MVRKTLRTEEELSDILAAGSLELAEPYDPDKSYPKNVWLLTECRDCGTIAHYRLKYIMDKSKIDEPVCRACYWRAWLREYPPMASSSNCLEEVDAERLAQSNGYELVKLLQPGYQGEAILLVRCLACVRQSFVRESDESIGCS